MSLPEAINTQDIIDATDECVMCGLCLPHCPTYTLAQTEPESPRGRIALVRALYDSKLETSHAIHSHLDHCLTCMNCERVCPANVDYEKIIDAGRAVTRKQSSRPDIGLKRLQASFLLFVLSKNPARKFVKACLPFLRSSGLHHMLSKVRLLHLLPDVSAELAGLNADLPDKFTNKSSSAPTVTLLNSCAGDLVNDETLHAARLIFSKLGCKVQEQNQTLCCGALHQHYGDLNTAKELRQNFVSFYERQDSDYLASLATGCGAQIKRYAELGDSSAKQLSDKLFDVNEFVLLQMKKSDLQFKPLESKVYLHKPCSQAQASTENDAVEKLLNYIPGIELVYFDDTLSCCGAGGINTLTQSSLARQLLTNKVLELKNSNADYLVSSNIGCALHFQAQLKQNGVTIQTYHPITLLAKLML